MFTGSLKRVQSSVVNLLLYVPCFQLDQLTVQSTHSGFHIFHERGQPLSVVVLSGQSGQNRNQLDLGYSQAAGVLSRGETQWTAARSSDKISVVLVWQPKPLSFFI